MNRPPAPLTGWRDGEAPRVLALDPATVTSGLVWWGGISLLRSGLTGMERLSWIRDRVGSLLRVLKPDVVLLEGYSLGQARGSSQSHTTGEFGGVLRLAIHDAGVPFVEVAPARLKLFATGKGNSGKDLVLAEAVRRLGYQGGSNDEADALWLYALGMHVYGSPIVELPKAHCRTLGEQSWPAIERPGVP